MVNILNINNLPNEYIIDFLGKANTSYLGKAAGSEKIYINIDRILPDLKVLNITVTQNKKKAI